ncbi:MAG: 50S ribosomal protein L11 methyltransferase [Candidatus Micrarchaeota archaeon]
MEDLRTNAQLVRHLESTGAIRTPHVKAAFERVDRAQFTKPPESAYRDRAASPKEGDAPVSQPSVIAEMIEALEIKHGARMRVMEVGTGSGYSTALTAHAMGSGRLDSFEPDEVMHALARKTLQRPGMKLPRVAVTLYPQNAFEHEPPTKYDRIIVNATAQMSDVERLAERLKEGGVIVAPAITTRGERIIAARKQEGQLTVTNLSPVWFVPLQQTPESAGERLARGLRKRMRTAARKR